MIETIKNMRDEVKFAIYVLVLGLSGGIWLVSYAHTNFATKETVKRIELNSKERDQTIKENLKYIRDRVDILIDRVPK